MFNLKFGKILRLSAPRVSQPAKQTNRPTIRSVMRKPCSRDVYVCTRTRRNSSGAVKLWLHSYDLMRIYD